MEDYSYLFNSNWFWCFCGIMGGSCLSLVISFIFYFIASKEKHISYRIKTSPASIDIDNHDIKDGIYSKNTTIYSSDILIRNVGSLYIEKNDFVPYCPITISISGKIITYEIKSNYYSNVVSTTNYDVEENDKIVNNISIYLDYLAKNDTIKCTCLHTGTIYAYALLKNGSFSESDIATKCGKWYVQLMNFIEVSFVIFIIFLTTLGIMGIIPYLIK